MEWQAAASALRPAVLARLSLQVVFRDALSRPFGAAAGAAPAAGAARDPVTIGGTR